MKMKQQQQQQQQSSSSSSPIFHIIGSMYVDLFCYLQNDIPVRGGDSYLLQPVSIQPGGSTTNTATHLNTFRIHHQQNQNQKKQQSEQHEQEQQNREQQNNNNNNNNNVDSEPNFCDSSIIIHSSINENDNYGKLLLQHTSKYDIKLINYHLKQQQQQQQQQQQVQIQSTEDNNGNDNDNNNNNNNTNNNTDSSTPHCVVIVADNERSFMSYQGCIDSFFPSIIDWTSILNNTQPIHIHIAGYYCTTGFINGQLLSSVQYIYKEKQRRKQQQCQQQSQKDDDSIILSLVTQSDATHQWDGGIYDLIPYLDYIIMNYDEATNIYQHGCTSKQQQQQQQRGPIHNGDRNNNTFTNTNTDTDTDEDELTNQLIQNFTSCNTTVCYVVTRGPNGAIAFRNGQIIASINKAVQVPIDTNGTNDTNIVLDPTGAGDAFAAGFLYGIWNTSNIQSDTINHNDNDANDNDDDTRMILNKTRIQNGLSWGCACGTAIVQIRGASTPASYETIHDLFLKQQQQQQQQQNENEI